MGTTIVGGLNSIMQAMPFEVVKEDLLYELSKNMPHPQMTSLTMMMFAMRVVEALHFTESLPQHNDGTRRLKKRRDIWE